MDRAGLYELLDTYLRALGSRNAKAVRWADSPRTSENNVMLEVGDGLWDIYFGPLKLGRMDERRRQIEDHKGRFARKTLSPMSPD